MVLPFLCCSVNWMTLRGAPSFLDTCLVHFCCLISRQTGDGMPLFMCLRSSHVSRVAEGTRLTSNLLLWMPLGLQGLSELLDM